MKSIISSVLILLFFISARAGAAGDTDIPENPFSRDFYERLGLKADTNAAKASITRDDIVSHYRPLAKKYHPQNGGDKNADAFSFITDAYKVLKDPEQRRTYDKYGIDAFPGLKSTWQSQVGQQKQTSSRSSSAPPHSSESEGDFFSMSNDSIDSLYSFFKARQGGVSAATDELALEILGRFVNLHKYTYEQSISKYPHYKELKEVIAADPIWKTPKAEKILSDLIAGDAFRKVSWTYNQFASMFGGLDPNSRFIRKWFFETDSPLKNTPPERDRFDELTAIMPYLLQEKAYRGTPAGNELIERVEGLRQKILRRHDANGLPKSMELGLLALLDTPEWRDHPTIRKLARETHLTEKSFWRLEERDLLKGLFERHPEAFHPVAETRTETRHEKKSDADVPKGSSPSDNLADCYVRFIRSMWGL